MILVPGGTFTMGAKTGTPQIDDEYSRNNYKDDYYKPELERRVTLTDYYIGATEVPQWLWVAVMGYNPNDRSETRVSFIGDTYPATDMSWNECDVFVRRLRDTTGRPFRLPSEAQWEFAAREGRDGNDMPFSGSYHIDEVAWYNGNSEFVKPGNVATKKPNALGLYDMTGNVQEWCSDWFFFHPYWNAGETLVNPEGRESQYQSWGHTYRGGTWWNCSNILSRWSSYEDGWIYTGLRLACDIDP